MPMSQLRTGYQRFQKKCGLLSSATSAAMMAARCSSNIFAISHGRAGTPGSPDRPAAACGRLDRADAQTMNYEEQQNPRLFDPRLHSLQEFISEGDESSPLGMDL